MKILTSVWEGFVLSIENGDGALSKFIRGSLQALTSLISTITPELEEQNSVLEDQREEFNTLLTILTDLNPESNERVRILSELNSKYNDFLPQLLTEKTTTEDLLAIQKDVNDQILLRIILQEKEAELKGIQEEIMKNSKRIYELQKAMEN